MSADMFEQERARAGAPLPNVHCSHERLCRHQHWVQQQDRQKESPGTSKMLPMALNGLTDFIVNLVSLCSTGYN